MFLCSILRFLSQVDLSKAEKQVKELLSALEEAAQQRDVAAEEACPPTL